MTPAAAIDEAKAGKLRPVYLVLGDELYFQRQVLAALRDATLEGGIAGLNDDQVLAQDVAAQRALQLARTTPMMSSRRLVLVRHVEHWEGRGESKRASADFDALAAYAQDPTPTSVLVLSATKLNARRKLVKDAKKQGFVVECGALDARELPGWVQKAAQRRGAAMSHGCAELLAELSGPELTQLDDAIERLTLYVGDGKEIDEAAIAECISSVKTQTVWQLVDAMGRRDVAGALGALWDVYDPADRGLRLLGVLSWSTRQLLRFRCAVDRGLAPADAAKAAGAPPFKARQLQSQTRRLATPQLEYWLTVLANVDLALKGGSKRPPRGILEEALIRLCTGH